MKPSATLTLRSHAIADLAGRFCVANPRVFGSMLHDHDRDDSDLYVLVDALQGTTLFDLGGPQVELEALLGVPVDLLTPGDLPVNFARRYCRRRARCDGSRQVGASLCATYSVRLPPSTLTAPDKPTSCPPPSRATPT